MSERDILAELANATPENPLIIDRPLSLRDQVIALNLNVFGYTEDEPRNMVEHYKYPFSITDNYFKQVEKEKGQWWGNLESQMRYAMTNCIDMGYIPFKLTYYEFDQKGIDGGTHKFYLSCEDRRISLQ